MVVLFTASAQPGGKGGLFAIADWITHGIAYLVLAVLACRALAGGLGRPLSPAQAVLAAAIALGYGITDELHQAFVPGRDSSVGDVVKDLLGATIGAAAFRRLAPRRGLEPAAATAADDLE
jgi:VanZ family protein